MNIVKRIVGLFSVMDEEVISFRLLFLQSLFIGFANSYYYVVSSTFLLKHVAVKFLPTSYIFTGICGFLLIQLYKDLQKKRGIPVSFRMALSFFTFICLFNFVAMMQFSGNKEFAVFLAYFTVIFAPTFTAIFALGLFAQCSRLYNIGQSKRLLALVVSGEILSSVLAFMSIPFLRELIKGHEYVLLPAAGFFTLLVFIPFNKLRRLSGEKFSVMTAAKGARKINFYFLRKDKFFLGIAVVSVFSVFAIYVIDYAYLISVRSMSVKTGFEIAQIASVFLFVVKLGELSFSFLSGKILSNKGVKFSLMLLPVILLLFTSFAFVSGFISTIAVLVFIFIAKLADRAIRKSITTPSIKVMYQVAEPHERLDIEASIDGLLNQVAIVISGIILLVISLLFFKEMDSLLHIFSFVCIVAFAMWCFFSLKMYDSYRVKIKDFLSKLKLSVKGSSESNARATRPENLFQQDSDGQLAEKVKEAQHVVARASRKDLINLVKIYNGKQFLDISSEADEKVAKRLVQIYYSNDFYFSRLLIIKYLQYFQGQTALTFLIDVWDVSDVTARLELIILFNELRHKQIDPGFFERQCEDCVNEIIWTDAAIYDTADLRDENLEKELNNHRSLLVYLLFELLKPVYEPSVLQVIFDFITNAGEIENQLFALELLDITLRPGLKEMIKPVLEPISFDDKKHKLEKIFHIYNLSPKERVVDILMKDYNLVNLKLREAALAAYYRIAQEKDALVAFSTHSIDSLKLKADEFISGATTPGSDAKKELLARLDDKYSFTRPYLPYLFNYAIFTPKHLRSHSGGYLNRAGIDHTFFIDIETSSKVPLKLDTMAIAILASLMQKQQNN